MGVLRRLTFDMRGPQKAQPFVGPLDGRVRALVAEAHEFGGLKHCWPKHTTDCQGLGLRRAVRVFAVVDSRHERGSMTKRGAPPWRRAHFLTIQLREAQAIA